MSCKAYSIYVYIYFFWCLMEDLDIYINRLKINILHKICILLVYIPLKHLINVEPDQYSYRWPQDNTRQICDRPGKATMNTVVLPQYVEVLLDWLSLVSKCYLLIAWMKQTTLSQLQNRYTTVFLVLFFIVLTQCRSE